MITEVDIETSLPRCLSLPLTLCLRGEERGYREREMSEQGEKEAERGRKEGRRGGD
jgi:hypothetical protein